MAQKKRIELIVFGVLFFLFSVLFLLSLDSVILKYLFSLLAVGFLVAEVVIGFKTLILVSSTCEKRITYLLANHHTFPIEILKKEYRAVYDIYVKLSKKKRRLSYRKLMQLRSIIENSLQIAKHIERKVMESSEGVLSTRKKKFKSLQSFIQKLPSHEQQRHYVKVSQIKEQLERGRV